MADVMTFPDDWHDFLQSYSFDDSEEIYTNGSRLIPVFRVEQLIEHLLKAQEPIEPRIVYTSNSKLYKNDMFKNHYCGNCGEFLHVVNRKDLFCSQCGRKVKWNDKT